MDSDGRKRTMLVFTWRGSNGDEYFIKCLFTFCEMSVIGLSVVVVVRAQLIPTPGTTVGGPPAYSSSLESDLREWLFASYDARQRPEKLNIVRISLNLLSLNYLDIKEQKISITAYFSFVWSDIRLNWITNSTYDNIFFLFSEEKSVWKPPIIAENSVDDIGVITRPSVPMRIRSNGVILWIPAGIFTTHCESHITYWPLDTQTCDVILSSWSYTFTEVQLDFHHSKTKILTSFYQENGEWELIGTEHSKRMTVRESESFSRLIFKLTFRRRPLFHTLNTLFPVVLMAFLTVAIFKLNPESGERVGLALTILLAFAVYLGVISESIPQTSVSASLLSTYIAAILFLQTLAVLLTVIYLDMHFTPEEKPVPKWLQSLTSACLSKLVCADRKSSDTKITPINTEMNGRGKSIAVEDYTEDSNNDVCVNDIDEEGDCTQYSWKEIASLLDKATMYIYLFLVTVFTIGVMIVLLHHYGTAYSSALS